MRLDWSYVAGIFDGEGCVNIGAGSGSVSSTIAQSGPKGLVLLEDIATFLRINGIRCVVYSTGLAGTGRRKLESYRLSVYSFKEAAKFLSCVIPMLRIKRTVAQDLIRYVTLFPSIVTSPLASRYRSEKQAQNLKSGDEWVERFKGCKMGRPKGSLNRLPRRDKGSHKILQTLA